jgi:4-amino-4-deoxy-L-arabinose transferase-like glycosyltransferase
MGSLISSIRAFFSSNIRIYSGVFTLFFVSRWVFSFFFGSDHFSRATDAYRIEQAVDAMLLGQFDLNIGRFIVAPLYPFFWAAHKWMFGQHWPLALLVSQWIVIAVGACFFYALAARLFNRRVAALATLGYAFFPTMLVWSDSFSSEAIFPSVFILSLFFLVEVAYRGKGSDLFWSALFFSFSFLLKSHVLLFAPAIIWYLFRVIASRKKALLFSVAYGALCLVATLPYGAYTLKKHGTYTLAGNGAHFHFYTGHSEFGYRSIVDVPPQDSDAFVALKQMDFSRFNGAQHDSLMQLPVAERQHAFGAWAIAWMKENPLKTAELVVYNTVFFLMPGVSFRHYPAQIWLALFLLSLPIYFGAYAALRWLILHPQKHHAFFVALFVTMLLFSMVFYVQNRFRTLTIEPIFIMYAAAWWLNRGGSFRPSEW